VETAKISEYYGRATNAEATLLCGDVAGAARLYREAATFHAEKAGSIKSTLDQVIRLIPALRIPRAEAESLLRPFSDVLGISMTTLLQRAFPASTPA
jgi:hypothetical protein